MRYFIQPLSKSFPLLEGTMRHNRLCISLIFLLKVVLDYNIKLDVFLCIWIFD